MRTGRPRKLTKPVTVCIVMEEKQKNELDQMKGAHSRGEYLNVLTISDNLKTRKILDLKAEVETLTHKINELTSHKENVVESFQKTIHSHFIRFFKEKLEEMPSTTKKFWAEKIGCKPQDLINYLQ